MDFSQFWSDFLSTVLGVALALVGAIKLEKYAQSRQEKLRFAEKEKRSKLILNLIKNELDYNLTALVKIDDNIFSTYNYLRIESWKSFSDGGEIKWIDDPELLNIISTAYSNLIQFILLYEKFFNMKFFPTSNIDNEQGRILANYTFKSKQDALDAIKIAKTKIEKRTSSN
ncbi:MAG: hypothetical protein HY964_05905 [Ignavibacteriales bacterium]|nr:hypothetical protein [Ignavibacteriales bacterium]